VYCIQKHLKMFFDNCDTLLILPAAWDQSEKFVKIYLDLKDVHKISAENVEVDFTERSFSVLIKDLNGKNHQMTVLNLLHPIDEKDSYKKQCGVLHPSHLPPACGDMIASRRCSNKPSIV
uniref:Calcyclin binding protein n=1 Tax=Xiphophorus couchianus TaxID=32473 RepID=A0A3B5KXI0_9TELE